MANFQGFKSPETGPVQVLYDEDLVKADLLNHFYTQKGERVMDAEYGFIGWDLIFELKTPGVKDMIEQDVRRIVQSDPRVSEQNINIIEAENGFTVQVNLYFKVLDSTSTLSMFFDENRSNAQV